MRRSLFLLLIGLLLAVALARAGSSALAAGPAGVVLPKLHFAADLADPFPIFRVRVSEGQLAGIVKQSDSGPLVRLSRGDFEDRVRKAALNVSEGRAAVRLVEANYTAELRGNDLVGAAQWVLQNENPRPAAFALDALRLAVRSAKWADGSTAVLGVLGPGFPAGPAVWVESGRHVLSLEWSLMGTAEPGERRFELRTPPCSGTSLELELPPDRVPVPGGTDVLLTGPFPTAKADRRLWRIRFGSASRLEIAIRASGNAGTARDPIRASLDARYDVEAGQTKCTFEYDLEPARGVVAEWVFHVDPGLRVTDVVVNDLAGWQTEPATTPAGTSTLRIRLRQPGPGGKVLISALAPPPDAVNADPPLPMLRPRNGLVGEERVEVRLASDLKPGGWSTGDYQLVEARPPRDGSHSLSFIGTLLATGASQAFRRPPGVAAAGAAPEFTTSEAIEWRAESGRMVMSASVQIRVRRGPLFNLHVQLPVGFSLTRLTSTPGDIVAYAGPTGGTPSMIGIEFQRPIATEQEVNLKFELRGSALPPAPSIRPEVPARLPLPRFVPVGAAERDGTLTLAAVSGWQVTAQVPGFSEEPKADGAYTIPYRGREPEGFLFLVPRQPDWSATGEAMVTRVDGRLLATTAVTLRIPGGSVSSVSMLIPEAEGRERTWRAVSGENALANVTSVPLGEMTRLLPLLAAPNTGLGPVLACGPILEGPLTFWRLTLARPASGELRLETTAPLASLDAGMQLRHVPLPTIADCPLQSISLVLDAGVASEFHLETPERDRMVPRDTRRPLRIRLQPKTPSADVPASGWQFTSLYQITHLDGSDAVIVVAGGKIVSTRGQTLSIVLPAGAETQAAAVGNKRLAPQFNAVSPNLDGITLQLPVPPGEMVPFEVRYRLPANARAGFADVISPLPKLPGEQDQWSRSAILGPDVTLLWPAKGETSELASALNTSLLSAPLRGSNHGLSGITIDDADTLLVARTPVLLSLRIVISALILALGWWLASRPARPSGWTLAIIILLLGLMGTLGRFAWESLLDMPLIAGMVTLLFLVIARARPVKVHADATISLTAESRSRTSAPVAVGTGLAIVFLGFLPPVHSQPAEIATVYILAGPDGESVMVPRQVLDRLDAITQRAEPGVVITQATYNGEVDDMAIRVRAEFTVRNFADGPAALSLPLSEAKLENVTIGDASAFPVTLKPDVYGIVIPSTGIHTVTATFTVPITIVGGNREVRFGIPEVPTSRLTLATPADARQVMLAGWRGEQIVDADASRLTADLGSARTVHLHWRQGVAGTGTSMKLKEACVWSVTDVDAELTACYLFRLEQGSTAGFRFDVPASVELTRVTVRSPDAASATAPVLRDWTLSAERAGVRTLRVQLQTPVEGRILVILEGVPRQPLTRQPSLRFPIAMGNIDVESSAFAFQPERIVVESLVRTGLTDAPPDALTRDFPGVSDLQFNPMSPPKVFRPIGNAVPELRPTLRAIPVSANVTQTVTWTLTATRRGEAVGSMRWSRKEDQLTAVEFDLPAAVRLIEVRGPDVAGWTYTPAGRVQAWFRSPVKDTTIEWLGTMMVGPIAKPPDPLPFEPPVPKPVHAGTVSTILAVRPADGWGARVEREQIWMAMPSTGREFSYRVEGSVPPPVWQLFTPRASLPAAQGFGRFEEQHDGLIYRAVLEQRLPRGRPHHLVFRAAELPAGAVVESDFSTGVRVNATTNTTTVKEWSLDIPAGFAETVRATIVIRLDLPKDELPLPVVSLAQPGGLPQTPAALAWLGLGASTVGKWRLRGVVSANAKWDAAQKEWPTEVNALRTSNGTLWNPRTPTASVRLATAVKLNAPLMPDVGSKSPQPTTIESTSSASPVPVAAPAPTAGLGAAGWCVTLALLAVLTLRFPESTWPEQVAILTGLLGLLVVGNPLVAVLVLVLARLRRLASHRRHPSSSQAYVLGQ